MVFVDLGTRQWRYARIKTIKSRRQVIDYAEDDIEPGLLASSCFAPESQDYQGMKSGVVS